MAIFLGEAKLGQFSTKVSMILTSQGLIGYLGLVYQYLGCGEWSAWLALLSLHLIVVSSSELKSPENQIKIQIL